MNTEVNEGRGFPLADEPAPVAIAPHRELLFRIIGRALRSEHGVRMRQATKGRTDYFAGRRAGAIADAAELMTVLYGAEHGVAKKALTEAVKIAGEAVESVEDLRNDDTNRALAIGIAEQVLRVI